jgi:transposase
MTPLPAGVKVHLEFGYTGMRKGMDGLALLVQEVALAQAIVREASRQSPPRCKI